MPEPARPREREPRVDTTVPHNARIWNYWLGGADNYPVDRELGDTIRGFFPEIVDNARADREFLAHAVTHLVREATITQFLDIGAGLPTRDNTHDVAQAVAPESRVVYVDNDPLVHAHASTLLVGASEGATDYVHADLRDPEGILRAASETLDLARPVAVMLLGVLNFVEDDDEVRRILRRLTDAVVPGSHLVISHPTDAIDPERAHEVVRAWNERGGTPKLNVRAPDDITALLDGWELRDPGMVSCTQWRPGHAVVAPPVHEYACVAVKPGTPG